MTRLVLGLCLLTGCRTSQFINDGQLPATQVNYKPAVDTTSRRPDWLSPYRPQNYPPTKSNH
ncbi:hypothetical protein [Hymenobacter fodinae]|uniref:Uncharacterized protein n=1 Tax=Hymenobacter fodinae TaxID=2510796 RepID=A0A4Z0P2G2_9BACT|nr:hypothetical protein [Hymenobacter fodinae]TGE05543.1 hypothetical protein EU556_19780 [Hymenobacter fodinae]